MKPCEPDLFTGLGRPKLPPGLKPRILTRARSAARSRPPLTDLLWESRRLRWAWAAMVVLLFAAQLILAAPLISPPGGPADPPAGPLAAAEPDLAPFLARHRIRDSEESPRLGGRLFMPPIHLAPLS